MLVTVVNGTALTLMAIVSAAPYVPSVSPKLYADGDNVTVTVFGFW